MQKVYIAIILLFYLSASTEAFAQKMDLQHKVDSLKEILYRSEEAIKKVEILEKLAMVQQYDSATFFNCIYEAIEISEANELPRKLSRMHGLIGWWLRAKGHADAEKSYLKCLEISRENDNKIGMINCLYNLGRLYRDGAEFELALQCLEEGISIARTEQDENGFSGLFSVRAGVYEDLGNYTEALKNHYMALDREKKSRNSVARVGYYLLNIGNLYLQLESFENAEEYLTAALDLLSKAEDKRGKAIAYRCLGAVHLKKTPADLFKALEYGSRALTIYDELPHLAGMAKANTLLGNIYLQKSSYDTARLYFGRADDVLKDKNRVTTRLEFVISYSDYLIKVDSISKARNLLEEWLKVCEDQKMITHKSNIMQNLFELEKAAGNFELALSFLETKKSLDDSIADAQLENRIDLVTRRMASDIEDSKVIPKAQNETSINWYFILISILVLGIIAILINGRRKKIGRTV